MTWPIRTGMPPLYHLDQPRPMETSNGQTHPSAYDNVLPRPPRPLPPTPTTDLARVYLHVFRRLSLFQLLWPPPLFMQISCFKPNQLCHTVKQDHPSRPPPRSCATQEACTAGAARTPGKQALLQLYAVSSSGPDRAIRAVAAPPPAQLPSQRLLPICRTYFPCNPVDDLAVTPLFTYGTRAPAV